MIVGRAAAAIWVWSSLFLLLLIISNIITRVSAMTDLWKSNDLCNHNDICHFSLPLTYLKAYQHKKCWIFFNRMMLSCKYSTWQLVAVTCIILASYQVQHFGENAAFGCEPRVSAVLVFTAASIQAKQNKTKHRLLQKIKTRLTRHTAASNYVLKQSKLNTANHTTRHHTGPAMFINKTSPAASQPSQVSS